MKVIALLAILCLFLVACSTAPADVQDDTVANDSVVDTTADDDLAALDSDLAALDEEADLLAQEDFDFDFEFE